MFTWVQCPRRPEEGVIFPKSRVLGSWESHGCRELLCEQNRLLTAQAISPAGPQLLNSYSGVCLPNQTRAQILGTCCSQNISLLSPHLGKAAMFLLEVSPFPLSASKPSVNVTSSPAFSLSAQASHLGQSSLLCQEAPFLVFLPRHVLPKHWPGGGSTQPKKGLLKGQGH